MLTMFQSLWAYRGFVIGTVSREFQLKYRNSLLGAAWAIINPLAMILVYAVIFSQVMKAKLPGIEGGYAYSIYLCAGLLTWGLFAEIVGRSQNVFIENANLLKKLSFPRITLPAIVVLNATLNFMIIFSLFLIFLWVTGNFPGWVVLASIPVILVELMLAIGLGITIGVLNVFFRDVGQIFGVVLQFWFWFTPVVYPADILPKSIQGIMNWNPMYPVISSYQEIFLLGKVPSWLGVVNVALLALLICFIGIRLFRNHVGEMVDEL